MNKLIKLSRLLSVYPEESASLLKIAQIAEKIDWEALEKWLGNSAVKVPLQHVAGKVLNLKDIKETPDGALGFGIYFTPEQDTARQSDDIIYKVWARVEKPLIFHDISDKKSIEKDPCVELLIQLGKEPEEAKEIVERAYKEKGYLEKQIYTMAISKGHDAILRHLNGRLSEVVIWDKDKLILTSEFIKN